MTRGRQQSAGMAHGSSTQMHKTDSGMGHRDSHQHSNDAHQGASNFQQDRQPGSLPDRSGSAQSGPPTNTQRMPPQRKVPPVVHEGTDEEEDARETMLNRERSAQNRRASGQSQGVPKGGKKQKVWDDWGEDYGVTPSGNIDSLSPAAVQNKRTNIFKKALMNRQTNKLYGEKLSFGGKVCEHPIFEPVCLFVIVLNAFWIGIELDQQDPDGSKTPTSTKFVESVFCLWFTLEIMVRIWAYEYKYNYFVDPEKWHWNIFDMILVLLLIAESWVLPFVVSDENDAELPALSSLRLLRLLRMIRVLRMVPELAMMVKSLVAALRSVSMTFVLALGIMYIFSILLTQWARNHKQEKACDPPANCVNRAFGTIPRSFLTLLQILCFDDTFSLIRAILDESIPYGLLLLLYILIAAFTVLNMLIGVVCQIVSSSSIDERKQRQRAKVTHLFDMLENADDSGYISRKELTRNRHVLDELEKEGVGEEIIKTAIDIFDRKNAFKAFVSEAGLEKDEFLEVIFKLLNAPQTQDILLVQSKLEKLEKIIEDTGAAKEFEQPATEIVTTPSPDEDEEQTALQKEAENEAKEAIARGMTELESQVASMLEQATGAARPQKGDEVPWDLELRRLDAAMCRLRVRLERCKDEKGPSNAGRRGAGDEAVQLANSELQNWRKLCAEVVQSISAASALMAQAIREVEPEDVSSRNAEI